MTKREDVKPGKNLKMAAGLVASAAAATVAAMAYKVNEEKINAGIDKAADVTKNVISKVSEKVKEVADDIMDMTDTENAADEPVCEKDIVDVKACECGSPDGEDAAAPEEEACSCGCGCAEADSADEKSEA